MSRYVAHLLCVSAIRNRFVIIIFKSNGLQQTVGNVFNNVPLNRKAPSPLVLLPEVHALVKINRTNHLGQANKLPTSIYLQGIR